MTLEPGRGTRRAPRVSHGVALVLVGLACLLAPLALTAVWLRDEVFDTNTYVATVAPLSSDPAIDSAVAAVLTNELFAHVDVAAEARRVLPQRAAFLALPLVAGVRGYTTTTVARFLSSSEFRRIWVVANREAHAALVSILEGRHSVFVSSDGSVGIDLSAAATLVRAELEAAGLQVFRQVPASVLDRRLVIVRERSLGRMRQAMTLLRRLAVALPVLAGVLLVLGLVFSRERRRTIAAAGIGVAGAAVLAAAAVLIGRSFYLDHVAGLGVPRSAAAAFYNTILRELSLEFRLLLLGGLALAVGALLAGPSPVAVRLRAGALRIAGRLADDAVGESATLSWVATNKADLRTVVVVVGGLLLVASDHATGSFLIEIGASVLVLVGAIEVLSRPGGVHRGGETSAPSRSTVNL